MTGEGEGLDRFLRAIDRNTEAQERLTEEVKRLREQFSRLEAKMPKKDPVDAALENVVPAVVDLFRGKRKR